MAPSLEGAFLISALFLRLIRSFIIENSQFINGSANSGKHNTAFYK